RWTRSPPGACQEDRCAENGCRWQRRRPGLRIDFESLRDLARERVLHPAGQGVRVQMKIVDAILKSYFVFLCLLFVTCGFGPLAGAAHGRVVTEMTQLGRWVAGFLVLVACRVLLDRTSAPRGLAFAQRLGALAERAAARSRPLYAFILLWTGLLAVVAIRRHL